METILYYKHTTLSIIMSACVKTKSKLMVSGGMFFFYIQNSENTENKNIKQNKFTSFKQTEISNRPLTLSHTRYSSVFSKCFFFLQSFSSAHHRILQPLFHIPSLNVVITLRKIKAHSNLTMFFLIFVNRVSSSCAIT